MQTIRCTLRPFVYDDSATILSWLSDRRSFRLWSANRYKSFPATPDEMMNLYEGDGMHPMTMVEDGRVVGHLLIKQLSPDKSVVRFCFVIVDDALRGRGYGKELCHLAIRYAKNRLRAIEINLGVFTDNHSALECYKTIGFTATSRDSYMIDGEKWDGLEMTLQM